METVDKYILSFENTEENVKRVKDGILNLKDQLEAAERVFASLGGATRTNFNAVFKDGAVTVKLATKAVKDQADELVRTISINEQAAASERQKAAAVEAATEASKKQAQTLQIVAAAYEQAEARAAATTKKWEARASRRAEIQKQTMLEASRSVMAEQASSAGLTSTKDLTQLDTSKIDTFQMKIAALGPQLKMTEGQVREFYAQIQAGTVDVKTPAQQELRAALVGQNEVIVKRVEYNQTLKQQEAELIDRANKHTAAQVTAMEKRQAAEAKLQQMESDRILKAEQAIKLEADAIALRAKLTTKVEALSQPTNIWKFSGEQIQFLNQARNEMTKLLETSGFTDAKINQMWYNARKGGALYATELETKVQGGMQKLLQATAGVTDQFSLMGKYAQRLMGILVHVAGYQVFYKLIGEITTSIGKFNELEAKIAEIRTISQDMPRSFDAWTESLRGLSNAWGKDLFDQTEAAYQALSNQIANAYNVTAFVENANKLAAVGISTTTEAGDLLATVLNSYNMAASQADTVSAQLFKTVDLGRLRIKDLANTFGDVTVPASQLGIGLAELDTALAVITVQGVKPAKAMTYLRNIMVSLSNPTKDMLQLFNEMGVTSGEGLVKAMGGLGGVLTLIGDKTNRSSTEIDKLVRRQAGLAGIMSLTTNAGKNYSAALNEITKSEADYARAIEIVKTTDAFKYKQALVELQNFFTVDLGKSVIKNSQAILGTLGGLTDGLKATLAMVKEAAIVWGTIYAIQLASNKASAAMVVIEELRNKNASRRAQVGSLVTTMAAGAAIGVGAYAYDQMEKWKAGEETYLSNKLKEWWNVDMVISNPMKVAEGYIETVTNKLMAQQTAYENLTQVSIDYLSGLERMVYKVRAVQMAGVNKELETLTKSFELKSKAFAIIVSDLIKKQEASISASGKEINKLQAQYDRLGEAKKTAVDQSETYDMKYQFGSATGREKLNLIQQRMNQQLAKAGYLIEEKDLIRANKTMEALKAEGLATLEAIGQKRQTLLQKQQDAADALETGNAEGLKPKQMKALEARKRRIDTELARLPAVDNTAQWEELGRKWAVAYGNQLEKQMKIVAAQREKKVKEQEEREASLEKMRIARTQMSSSLVDYNKLVAGGASSKELKDFAKRAIADFDTVLGEGVSNGLFGAKLGAEQKKAVEDSKANLLAIFKTGEIKQAQAEELARYTENTAKLKDLIKQREAAIQQLTGTEVKSVEATEKALGLLEQLTNVTSTAGGTTTVGRNNMVTGQIDLVDITLPATKAIPEIEQLRKFLNESVDDIETKKERIANLIDTIKAKLLADPTTASEAKPFLNRLSEYQANILNHPELLKNSSIRDRLDAQGKVSGETRVLRKMQDLLKREMQAAEAKYPELSKPEQATDAYAEAIKLLGTIGDVVKETETAPGWNSVFRGSIVAATSDMEALYEMALKVGDAMFWSSSGFSVDLANGGKVPRFAGGGRQGMDSVPAMLSPGEFVMNRKSSGRFYSQLVGMNAARLANGGAASSVTTGDFNITLNSTGQTQTDIVSVGRALQKQVRRSNLRFGG